MNPRKRPNTSVKTSLLLKVGRLFVMLTIAISLFVGCLWLLRPASPVQGNLVTLAQLPQPSVDEVVSPTDRQDAETTADCQVDLRGNPISINVAGIAEVEMDDEPVLENVPTWNSVDYSKANSVVWGDMDGNGDLDLAIGNLGTNQIYLNNDGVLAEEGKWPSSEMLDTRSMAWGDMDGDGDLDLAVGNYGAKNQVYLNSNGVLVEKGIWASNEVLDTRSVAWGDMNGDGFLDLAVGNCGAKNQVYLNIDGRLEENSSWFSDAIFDTRSVAWGDMNSDGYLDLAIGNYGAKNQVYLNDTTGDLEAVASWSSIDEDHTTSVAWGDIKGDGYLDLVAGNYFTSTKLYLNDRQGIDSMLKEAPSWSSIGYTGTNSVAWGDANGDGFLDLAVGSSPASNAHNRIHLNKSGNLEKNASWRASSNDDTRSVAWGDIDGDGELDLAVGNYTTETDHPNLEAASVKIYLNRDDILLVEQSGGVESDNPNCRVSAHS